MKKKTLKELPSCIVSLPVEDDLDSILDLGEWPRTSPSPAWSPEMEFVLAEAARRRSDATGPGRSLARSLRTQRHPFYMHLNDVGALCVKLGLDLRSGDQRWLASPVSPYESQDFTRYRRFDLETDLWTLQQRYSWAEVPNDVKMVFCYHLANYFCLPGQEFAIYIPKLDPNPLMLLKEELPLVIITVLDNDRTTPLSRGDAHTAGLRAALALG